MHQTGGHFSGRMKKPVGRSSVTGRQVVQQQNILGTPPDSVHFHWLVHFDTFSFTAKVTKSYANYDKFDG